VCKAIGSTIGAAPLLPLLPLLILLLLPSPLLLQLLLFLSLQPVLVLLVLVLVLVLLLLLLVLLLLSTPCVACSCRSVPRRSASFNRSTSWALAQKTRVDPSRSHGSAAAFDRTFRSFIHTFMHSIEKKGKRRRGRKGEGGRGREGGGWQYVRAMKHRAIEYMPTRAEENKTRAHHHSERTKGRKARKKERLDGLYGTCASLSPRK
jgi:hypothetical protein